MSLMNYTFSNEIGSDVYQRRDLTTLDKNGRAGEFAMEFYSNKVFNEAGKRIVSISESVEALGEIPAYIEQQEALFQEKQLQKIENTPTPL